MKKIFSLIVLAAFVLSISAQLPAIKTKWKVQTQGIFTSYLPQGYEKTFNTTTFADTLKTKDTVVYIFPVSNGGSAKSNIQTYLYLQFKLISADSTDHGVKIAWFQSADYAKWDTLKAGTSPVAYTKTLTATKTTLYHANGLIDNVYYDGNYVACRIIGAGYSTFKVCPDGIFGTIIKK